MFVTIGAVHNRVIPCLPCSSQPSPGYCWSSLCPNPVGSLQPSNGLPDRSYPILDDRTFCTIPSLASLLTWRLVEESFLPGLLMFVGGLVSCIASSLVDQPFVPIRLLMYNYKIAQRSHVNNADHKRPCSSIVQTSIRSRTVLVSLVDTCDKIREIFCTSGREYRPHHILSEREETLRLKHRTSSPSHNLSEGEGTQQPSQSWRTSGMNLILNHSYPVQSCDSAVLPNGRSTLVQLQKSNTLTSSEP